MKLMNGFKVSITIMMQCVLNTSLWSYELVLVIWEEVVIACTSCCICQVIQSNHLVEASGGSGCSKVTNSTE